MIKLGIDFDNTITDYTSVFRQVALKKKIIKKNIPVFTKNEIKNYLIHNNNEKMWTELQGLVYGKYLQYASPQPYLIDTLTLLKTKNIQLYIISHRTLYPYIGEKVNLHDAAKKWIHLNIAQFFDSENIFFEMTIEDKIKRANNLGIDFFIDDLEKILLHPNLSNNIYKILYDPEKNYKDCLLKTINQWNDLNIYLVK